LNVGANRGRRKQQKSQVTSGKPVPTPMRPIQ
jgi:hypothetical protein